MSIFVQSSQYTKKGNNAKTAHSSNDRNETNVDIIKEGTIKCRWRPRGHLRQTSITAKDRKRYIDLHRHEGMETDSSHLSA